MHAVKHAYGGKERSLYFLWAINDIHRAEGKGKGSVQVEYSGIVLIRLCPIGLEAHLGSNVEIGLRVVQKQCFAGNNPALVYDSLEASGVGLGNPQFVGEEDLVEVVMHRKPFEGKELGYLALKHDGVGIRQHYHLVAFAQAAEHLQFIERDAYQKLVIGMVYGLVGNIKPGNLSYLVMELCRRYAAFVQFEEEALLVGVVQGVAYLLAPDCLESLYDVLAVEVYDDAAKVEHYIFYAVHQIGIHNVCCLKFDAKIVKPRAKCKVRFGNLPPWVTISVGKRCLRLRLPGRGRLTPPGV